MARDEPPTRPLRPARRPPERPPERPHRPPAQYGDDRSIGDLFKDLMHEARTLVRQEINLAKTEIEEKATEAGRHARYIAVGSLVAYAGFLALVVSAGYLLGMYLPVWLGFLIAGMAVLVVGIAFYRKGQKELRKIDFSLDRTAETLQEDALWIKQEVQEIVDDPSHLGARA